MAYAANSSGCGGIPEGTRTVPSSSTHSSGLGNTRNPILCTESTPQKNGRDTSSSVSRILNRLMPLSIGMRHSPLLEGRTGAAGRDSARRTFQRIPSRSVHTLGIPYGMEGTSHMGMEHAESGNAPLFPWRLPRQDTDRP